MDVKDLEYLLENNPYSMNVYSNNIVFNLPDIHLDFLKKKHINYRFNPAPKRYQRSIDILRLDDSIITTIEPPKYKTNDSASYWLVKNKIKTDRYLKNFNIPTANTRVYTKDQMIKAKEESFENSDNPVVIKPLYGTLGKGVMVNVKKSRFEYNWKEATNYLSGSNELLVQNFLEGFEARATIIEGKLLAITVRIPPYVIGNGKSDIEKLIDEKNERRKECAYLSNYPIKKHKYMNEFLSSNNIDISYVPEYNEKILLGSVSNLTNGGELLNITHLVSQEIKDLALNTVASFPGLYTAGLDMIFKSFDDKEATILEVNSFPVIALAAYPTYGETTHPSKAYIEAVISKDQYLNKRNRHYTIENHENYIENYLSFSNRRNTQIDKNYSSILQIMS